MDTEQIKIDRESKKKRVEELGSTLAKIRARVKANRSSAAKTEDDIQASSGSKLKETALTKILEQDRVRFHKHLSEKVKIKKAMDQIMIEREEQKKVEKQLQEAIARVTAPTPELPPLIKQRIIDLETAVENLKEKLSDKDKVISSKSQALTVLHNQLMQRSKEHTDRVMAITEEVSALKEDFDKRENNWKKELQRLKLREEELEHRLLESESNNVDVDSLKSELDSIRLRLNEAENKNEEVFNKFESTKKINLKFEAQLKALKQENDKLTESLSNQEEVEAMKNQIAVLREEKESFQSAFLKSNAIEEEMSRLKESLKSISTDKETLRISFEKANEEIKLQSTVIKELEITLKNVEDQKNSSEMRFIDMEDQWKLQQSNSNMHLEHLLSEISVLKDQLDKQNLLINSLNHQLTTKDQEIADIKGNNFRAELDSNNYELTEKIKELQLKSEGYEDTIINLNESLLQKTNLLSQLQSTYEETVVLLNELKQSKDSLETENVQLKAESSLKKEKKSSESVESKEENILTQKFKKLAANYKIRTKQYQELEEKLKIVNGLIVEKDNIIILLTDQQNVMKTELDSLKNVELENNQELENVKLKNGKLLAIIEELTPKLEELEAERSSALIGVDKMNKAFEELKEWKESEANLLKQHVTSVNSMASHVLHLEDELSKLQVIVNGKNNVIGELEVERKKLVSDMKHSEDELERLRELYQQESVKNQKFLTNLESLENEMIVSREEMNQIAQQLDNVTTSYNMCLENLQKRENYIETLEQDIVNMKSKMYNLESSIEDKHRMLHERGNQLSAKLEEAEILRHAYDKYQVEMDKKFKLNEENENSLKNNVTELQNEIHLLMNSNCELMKEKEEYVVDKSKMITEIEKLNNISNSYNSTLDRIEILNEELKQVMDDFDTKNQELKDQLDEKNNTIIQLQNELTSLQANFEELEQNKQELRSTDQSVSILPDELFNADIKNGLLTELEEKSKSLEAAQNEISNLQITINSILNQKETEINSLQEQINKLSIDKNVLNDGLNISLEENMSSGNDIKVFSWDQHDIQETYKDSEEGWGWMGSEAHLEQDHKHSEALQIQNLTQKVKDLEIEQKNLTDKLASSKIKCVKLLKKLKETEAINEEAKIERSVGFGDLNFALQEELRSQLDQLEFKNKELLNELNSLKLERNNVAKRADILSSANDELIEKKERQDIEVEMWQKRNSDLKNELQALQWTIEELKSEKLSLNDGDNELSEKFNALVAENESLQGIICNLKDGRPLGSPNMSLELNSLKEELNKLKEIRLKEKEYLENDIRKANEEIETMEMEIDGLSKENQELKINLNQISLPREDNVSFLSDKIEYLTKENKELLEQLAKVSNNMILENESIKVSEADVQLSVTNEEIMLLQNVIEQKSKENDEDKVVLVEMKKEIDALLEKMQQLGIENSNLKEKLLAYSQKDITSQNEVLVANTVSNNGVLEEIFQDIVEPLPVFKGFFAQSTNPFDSIVLTTERNQAEIVHKPETEDLKDNCTTRINEKLVIEKQREKIQELMEKLEYINQTQSIKEVRNDNEELLKMQLNELSNHLKTLEISNYEFKQINSSQSEEISKLSQIVREQENQRAYLQSLITDKHNESEKMNPISNQQLSHQIENNDAEINKYSELIKQKDLEIKRVTKVLHDTQEKLVHVQDSKPHDKVVSLQSKLDNVLYTLHERDVRCDELTREIMQLLEERDTLQLRLSDSLKENEIIKKGNTGSSVPTPELRHKIGELHKGYSRDPVVKLEMESRHSQQMNLYSKEEESKDEQESAVDYGFFNWFFSSPSSNSSQK